MSLHDDTALRPDPRDNDGAGPPHKSFWRSRGGVVAIGFLLVAAFLLVSEHRAHALGYLPFLLLLACPLMHMFMHHGHGHHAGHQPGERPPGPDGGNR